MTDQTTTADRDPDVPAMHREHQMPGRPYRLSVRLSRDERDLVVAAARAARLTPTGYAAKAAVAAASSEVAPAAGMVEALRELQRELFAARRAVAMLGSNVNQAAAAYHSTGQLPEWVGEAVALTAAAVARLDEVTGRVDRRLR
jgi:uncharacterized protein (DUF1778 family)